MRCACSGSHTSSCCSRSASMCQTSHMDAGVGGGVGEPCQAGPYRCLPKPSDITEASHVKWVESAYNLHISLSLRPLIISMLIIMSHTLLMLIILNLCSFFFLEAGSAISSRVASNYHHSLLHLPSAGLPT